MLEYSRLSSLLFYLLECDFPQQCMARVPSNLIVIMNNFNEVFSHKLYFGYSHLYKKTLFYLQLALFMANKVAILTFEKDFSKLYSFTARMTFFCYFNAFCLEGMWSTWNTCCVTECSFHSRSCYHNSCFLRRT